MRRRTISAVTGNVEMKVTIARRGTAATRAGAGREIAAHGYDFTFSFVGFYPPSRAMLHALVADPRLVSVSS